MASRLAARMLASVGIPVSLVLLPGLSSAQPQNKNEQSCLNTMNKSGAKVRHPRQGKQRLHQSEGGGEARRHRRCVLHRGRQEQGPKGRDKTVDGQSKKCSDTPDFGFTGAVTVNAAAIPNELYSTTSYSGPRGSGDTVGRGRLMSGERRQDLREVRGDSRQGIQ